MMEYILSFIAIASIVLINVVILMCTISFPPFNDKQEDNLQNAYNQGYKDGRKMLSIINKKNKKTHKF